MRYESIKNEGNLNYTLWNKKCQPGNAMISAILHSGKDGRKISSYHWLKEILKRKEN